MQIAFVFPGQGSQSAGMLAEMADAFKKQVITKLVDFNFDVKEQPEFNWNDYGEFEAVEGGGPPELVETSDIRGVLHNHSTWSDGAHSIEEMALPDKPFPDNEPGPFQWPACSFF